MHGREKIEFVAREKRWFARASLRSAASRYKSLYYTRKSMYLMYAAESWLGLAVCRVLYHRRATQRYTTHTSCTPTLLAFCLCCTLLDLNTSAPAHDLIPLRGQVHASGMLVGLKNVVELTSSLVSYFDFAINESCHEYDECDVSSAMPTFPLLSTSTWCRFA